MDNNTKIPRTYVELYECEKEYKTVKECMVQNPSNFQACEEKVREVGRCILEKFRRASKLIPQLNDSK